MSKHIKGKFNPTAERLKEIADAGTEALLDPDNTDHLNISDGTTQLQEITMTPTIEKLFEAQLKANADKEVPDDDPIVFYMKMLSNQVDELGDPYEIAFSILHGKFSEVIPELESLTFIDIVNEFPRFGSDDTK